MEDKEVGEQFWPLECTCGLDEFLKEEGKKPQWNHPKHCPAYYRPLTRNLVEERARAYANAGGWERGTSNFVHVYTDQEAMVMALRDFGIDPATWPKE